MDEFTRRERRRRLPWSIGHKGRGRDFLLTRYVCPHCGKVKLEYRRATSIGKRLMTYCGNCNKMGGVVLEDGHVIRPYDWTGQEFSSVRLIVPPPGRVP